jgi:hypothetical protein
MLMMKQKSLLKKLSRVRLLGALEVEIGILSFVQLDDLVKAGIDLFESKGRGDKSTLVRPSHGGAITTDVAVEHLPVGEAPQIVNGGVEGGSR